MDSNQDLDFNPTGSADEFLALANDDVPTPDAESDPDEQTAQAAAADHESADEDDLEDLSPEERVAAMLAEETADEGETEEAAADDADAGANEATDLDALTPEQMRELAEEALRLRAEANQPDVAAIQREADAAVAVAVQETRGRVDATFQREILDVSEAHYGGLIDQAIAKVIADANRQTALDPERYIEQHGRAEVQKIQRAQRAWEAQQRREWEPRVNEVLEQAGRQALKAHPGIRQLYATALAEERKLPQKAIQAILEEADTDRMAERADWLAQLRDVKVEERRRGNQQVREEAAKRVSATRISSPPTGKAKPAKVTPIKGEQDEWLSALRHIRAG